MVDAEDLKSFGYCNRVGSSPTIPTKKLDFRRCGFFVKGFGCVAQLVRALRSHRRGRRFESAHIHQKNIPTLCGAFFLVDCSLWISTVQRSCLVRKKVDLVRESQPNRHVLPAAAYLLCERGSPPTSTKNKNGFL